MIYDDMRELEKQQIILQKRLKKDEWTLLLLFIAVVFSSVLSLLNAAYVMTH